MPSQSLNRTFRISDLVPVLEVHMTVHITFAWPRYSSVGMGAPKGMPYDLLMALWDDEKPFGIVNGVHEAIGDSSYSIDSAEPQVDFPEITFSESVEDFSEAELETLRMALQELTQEMVSNILAGVQAKAQAIPVRSFTEAKSLILTHSWLNPEDPRSETGFLGALLLHHILVDKQDHFELSETNFREVMEALTSLTPYLLNETQIDKEILHGLWFICRQAPKLIRPDNWWRERGFMTAEDAKTLEVWIDTISYAVNQLLDGHPIDCRILAAVTLGDDWLK